MFIQTKGETGLDTLIGAGRLPEISHWQETQDWEEMLAQVNELINSEHNFKTLVIDTLNGAERMCHEEVCRRDFNGNWTDKGFASYGKGPEVALADWRTLLSSLDRLRETRRMSIVCLSHTKVKPFKNPEGSDYDRYQPDMHEKSWGLSHKWADAVLFMNFETFVDQKDATKKGKATSSQARIMYTERHAAYDAKNRFGLPTEILLGSNGQESWNIFLAALKAGRTQTAKENE